MTKRSVLWVSFFGVLLFLISMYSVMLGICEKSDYYCRKDFDIVQNISGIFFVIFLLSLITYRMREDIFRAWWNFARWFAPIIVLITFLQDRQLSGGGVAGVIGRGFDMFILGVLYAVLIAVSLVQIFRSYRRIVTGKQKDEG